MALLVVLVAVVVAEALHGTRLLFSGVSWDSPFRTVVYLSRAWRCCIYQARTGHCIPLTGSNVHIGLLLSWSGMFVAKYSKQVQSGNHEIA